MVLPPNKFKVPTNRVSHIHPPVEPVGPVAVAAVDDNAKTELEKLSPNTALVPQPEQSKPDQAMRQILGDAKIVRGKNDWVFIQVNFNENLMQYKVGSQLASQYLRQQAYKEGVLLKDKQLQEINQTIKAYATMELKPVAVHLRIAPIEGGVEIDLGDEGNKRVRITPGQVTLLDQGSNTLFYRTHLTLPMTHPAQKGDLKKIRKYVRNIEETSHILLIAWITYTLAHPRIDSTNFVHLVILGPQGAGKSFLCRLLGMLIDPNVINLQTLPKNPKDFMVAAQNSHLLFYDNIRFIVKVIMDLMCGAATGTSSASRQLFTDDDISIMFLHVAMVLNGIYDFITESDLVQRSLILNLQQMDEKNRVSEKVLLAELETDLPEIMMGMFQLIANVLKVLPIAEVTRPERMIDFCQWLAAMEMVNKVGAGTYQALYSETLQTAQLSSLLENDFASEVYKFADKLEKHWKGTPTELFRELSDVTSIRNHGRFNDWPKSVESMSKRLKTLLPALNTQGIFITFSKSRDRSIEITTTRIEEQY